MMHYNNFMGMNFTRSAIRKYWCIVCLVVCQFSYATEHVTLQEIGIPQDAKLFIQSHQSLISAAKQKKESGEYIRKYFLPWTQPLSKNEAQVKKIKYLEEKEIQFYKKNKTWGENLSIHSPKWINDIEKNSAWVQFPNFMHSGIVVENTSLRSLPTKKPTFLNPSLAGEGYPFDILQKTFIPAGTPIHILHRSVSLDFYYVQSPISTGWIPANKVALVNKTFVHKWTNNPFIVLTKENISIIDQQKFYRFTGSIGAIFPLHARKQDNYSIYIPIADQYRNAVMVMTNIPKNSAAIFPLSFTQDNAAMLINQLLQQAYGWGGALGNRDCSATTRDLFNTFGIWLPRHSTDQLAYAHEILLNNMSNKQKIKTILNKGIPFLTLLGHPGHVMLYLGEYKNQLIVFHNKWGLKSFNADGKEERVLIGFSALTPLSLGSTRTRTESLLDSVDRMTIFFK